jgi:hypothetical protein
MEKINQNRVQNLISYIDSCTNPREGRAYLNTLRTVLKAGDNYTLDYETLDEVVRVESQRGDSLDRVIKLHKENVSYSNFNLGVSAIPSEVYKLPSEGQVYRFLEGFKLADEMIVGHASSGHQVFKDNSIIPKLGLEIGSGRDFFTEYGEDPKDFPFIRDRLGDSPIDTITKISYITSDDASFMSDSIRHFLNK